MERHLVLVLVFCLLVGCGAEPTPTPDLVATQTALEEAARATMTAEAPTPTETPEPTDTATPTFTPTPAATPTDTPEPTYTPGLPTCAVVGETWTRPADGAAMVCVPAGEFLMGSTDDDPDADRDEKPQHTVYLDAFWIDKTEVTNAQYRKCVEAGACEEPECWRYERFNAPDQPVVCVTWDEAQTYVAWVAGRLPTEAEWEKAARGTDGRQYPWGNTAPDCSQANVNDCTNRPSAVGSYPADASSYGVMDMAGNVREWVADRYDEEYYSRSPARNPRGPDSGEERVMRGGAFGEALTSARCAFRDWDIPDDRLWSLGFRVVVAPGPSGP